MLSKLAYLVNTVKMPSNMLKTCQLDRGYFLLNFGGMTEVNLLTSM